MKNAFLCAGVGLLAGLAVAAPFETTCDGYCVGPVKISCAEAGGWTFATTRGKAADGVETMEIVLTAAKPLPPPKFSVGFDFDQVDAHHKWTTRQESVTLPPNWGCHTSSRLCYGMPLVAFLNDNDRNRIAVSCSEAKRTVGIDAGLREEDCHLVWKLDFFGEAEAPLASYRTQIRFDRRDVFFGDAIAAGSRWISETAGLKPAPAPAAAFEPLYSAWYSFHQNVHDREIEAECAEAAKLGMKVLIVDDGWQTDDNNRGYSYCGDWQISKNRFPDMAAHVAKVHALGMKYMIWYGVPMIGLKSANYARFKGKYLWTQNDRWSGYSCLDPRFPEVRKFLCGIYEKAMREWNLDGLKLDFIDAIGFRGADPAVKENYAGRDIRSLSEAVDRLMKDVYATLTAVKPDALVEFRQGYIGPGIRQYGNMMRAADCPGDLLANRCRIANLRLTSGDTAVHADMLEWNVKESPEQAARFVLSTMFGVIQYSVMLRTLPESHKKMIAHWLDFSQKHRDALLKGAFRPRHFEAFYPVLEAENAKERIVGVYNDAAVADCGAADRDVYVLNATGKPRLAVRLAVQPAKVEAFDTFGNSVAAPALAAGLQDVALPVSGYLKITFTNTELPGYVGAVAGRDGNVVFDVQGFADLATRRRMTPDTLFWAASNTKGVAAALMLTVVDEGKVALDDPVEKYLPEFAGFKVADKTAPGGVRPPKTKPTVRQVLSHTSGLRFFPSMPIDRWTVRELAKMACETPQPNDPGAVYQYSNWGIDVAMAIVEAVSGRPWNELLQTRILDPLGMKDTTFFPTEAQLARLATAYRVKDDAASQAMNVDQFQYPYTLKTRTAEAGGGLFTTPRDFMRFLQMLASNGVASNGTRILSKKAMDEWTRKQTPANVTANYSFGMNVDPRGRSLSHGGAYQTFGEANLVTGVARLYFVQIAGGSKASRARAGQWLKDHVTAAAATPR